MKCPRCGSENVNVQITNETHLKTHIIDFYGGFVLDGGGFLPNGYYLPYQL